MQLKPEVGLLTKLVTHDLTCGCLQRNWQTNISFLPRHCVETDCTNVNWYYQHISMIAASSFYLLQWQENSCISSSKTQQLIVLE